MATMPVNSTNTESSTVYTQHQVGSPAGTYLISQGGGYYPIYNTNGYEAQAVSRPCCHGAFQRAEQTAKYDEANLYSLKANVKVDFAEVFQESQGSESFNVVWRYNKAIYTYTMMGFYTFLCALLGPTLAICWGIIFACMNFILVWTVNPALKLVFQVARIAEILCRGMVRAVLDPIFQSIGQLFAFLRGNFTLSLQGLEVVTKKDDGSGTTTSPASSDESQA